MQKSKQSVIRNLNQALKKFNGKNSENKYQNYIFVILFYRFLSIDIVKHVKNKYNKNYDKLSDTEAERLKSEIINDQDYFIAPSELFQNVIKERKDDIYLDSVLNSIFNNIRKSSKYDICDIFKSIDVEDEKIGSTNKERSQVLSIALKAIGNIKYDFEETEYDLFGLVYEVLLNKYDDNLKISLGNGVYYTPSTLVKLLIEISQLYISEPKNIYDPTCGSGSLLIEYAKFNNKISFFGQELLSVPYGLCKMNMILHGVKDYHINNANTLLTYNKDEKEKYDLILSNPPFSVSWDRSPAEDDERFKNVPMLPPENYADYAFIYHIIHALKHDGIALVIDGPAMLGRTLKGNDETLIREHLVKENLIDAIIQLPNNFFLRTSIGACLFVIRKNKKDNNILFIDATSIYTTSGHTKTFSDDNAKCILDLITQRKNVDDLSYLATPEEIADHNYTLSVESYINYKEKKTFKQTIPNILTPNLLQELEYQHATRYGRFFNQLKDINTKFSEIIEQLMENKDIQTIKLSDIAISIKSGTKLTQIGAISNDDLPYYYITSKEIEDGNIIPISTRKSGDGRDIKGTQKINKEALKELLRLSNLEKDDVLFTLSETGPKVAIVHNPNFGFNPSIFVLKPKKDKINPLFLKYMLESDYMKNQISNKLSHGNAKSIKIEKYRNLIIPDIPLETQEQIASLLGKLQSEYTLVMDNYIYEQYLYKEIYNNYKNKLFNDITEKQRKEK